MSRSVETIRGANIIYFDAHKMNDESDRDNLLSNLQYEISARYKSFRFSEKYVSWPYRENRIILENDHVQISISEYCGCGAISVFINESTGRIELAEHWLNQCFAGIEKIIEQFVLPLRKVATLSNGETIYEKKYDKS